MHAADLLVVVFLILLNGLFAMTELAIVSSRPSRLRQLAADGRSGAEEALRLGADPTRFLATVQIGMTLIAILNGAFTAGAFGEPIENWLKSYPVMSPYAKTFAIGIVVITVAYLTLIAGELAPKQIALKYPEVIASRLARPLALVSRAATPLVWFVDLSTSFVLRIAGLKPGFERAVTEEEIHTLIAEGERSGAIQASERQMIEGVLDLADNAVRTIMTPRPDVAWIDLELPKEKILDDIRTSPHAQMLVSRGSIDELVGIIRKQDLLDQALAKREMDVEKALHPPLIVPESASILRTLDLFRSTPSHTAVIVDEYGSIQGILTRTDLLEAVAGDLPKINRSLQPSVLRRDDGSLMIDATQSMADVKNLLKFEELPPGDFLTLAGFVLSRLEHMPKIGEHVDWAAWRFSVVSMDGHRIDRILAQPIAEAGRLG
ncbi:MAG: hemolysin family protein [Steroidobacteraceae bacterium]|jgi:putative hemolysin